MPAVRQINLGSLLASGITIWIVVEALLNMAVMVNLLPHAGNALPLISYGGSNMTVTLASIGILLNVARSANAKILVKEVMHLVRLLICAGGTGGGVYPALVVRQTLGNDANPVLWVGSEGGMEADLVQRAGIPYTTIPAGQVAGMGLRTLPNLVRVAQGTLASRRILKRFKPDVLLFTGGYVAVPMALAGLACLGAKFPAWSMYRTSSRAWRSSCWLALPPIALTTEDFTALFSPRGTRTGRHRLPHPPRPERWTREQGPGSLRACSPAALPCW